MKKSKRIWTIIRTLTFLVIGLMNTVLIKPEDVGGWKNYVGYAFLILTLVDLFLVFRTLKIDKRGQGS